MNTLPLRNVTNINSARHGKHSEAPSPARRSMDEVNFEKPTYGASEFPTPTPPAMSSRLSRTPGSLPEYGREILDHFLVRERTMLRNPTYLHNQPEVTERMRCILLDWMVDVHIKFKLHPETYFLAVDVIDRYLAETQCTRAKLQLVGVTATLLSAKHEEIWPPEVKDCVYIAANTYTREDILECERDVSNQLQFKLAVPTSYPIMSFCLDAMEASPKLKYTAMMFLEAAAIDYGCLRFLPSVNAFAAIALANLTVFGATAPTAPTFGATAPTSEIAWSRFLEGLTRTEYQTILPCAEHLLSVVTNFVGPHAKYHATGRKFASSKYLEVAAQPFPTLPLPPA